MIKMKVDKYSTLSAFVYYLIVPFVIFGINWFGDLWWLRGGIVSILMATPVIILVAKEDKKSPIAMTDHITQPFYHVHIVSRTLYTLFYIPFAYTYICNTYKPVHIVA